MRTTLFVSVLVLAIAALVYVLRYVLLVINRNTLLNSVVAGAADWLGVAASAAAIVALIACVVVLIRWLIARRAAAFSHYALPEHRSAPALWAGCLVPFANLLWAPVYVIELAALENPENHYARLQRPIMLWWIAGFSATSFRFSPSHPALPRTPRASPTTPSSWCLRTCLLRSQSHPLPGSSKDSSANRSIDLRTAGWW